MNDIRIKLLPNFPSDLVDPATQLMCTGKPGDAGVDLYAAEDCEIGPGERKVVPLGFAMAIPEGYEAQIRPRSGNASKLGITIPNTPATIDPGFRGEMCVILHNTNPVIPSAMLYGMLDMIYDSIIVDIKPDKSVLEALGEHHRNHTVRFQRGDRIAQLVFAKFERPDFEIVDELDRTARGEGGFGSTGI